jgi:hypothetical protein
MTVKVLGTVPFAGSVTGDGAMPQLRGAMGELQFKVTTLLNPFKDVITTVEVRVNPTTTLPEAGETAKLKSTTAKSKMAW